MNFNVHLIEMAGGNSNGESSNNLIIENDDKGTESSFVDARKFSDSNHPKSNTSN